MHRKTKKFILNLVRKSEGKIPFGKPQVDDHHHYHGLGHSACSNSRFKTGPAIVSLVFLLFFFLLAYIPTVYMRFNLDSSLGYIAVNSFDNIS
jgi:hypothetical protein